MGPCPMSIAIRHRWMNPFKTGEFHLPFGPHPNYPPKPTRHANAWGLGVDMQAHTSSLRQALTIALGMFHHPDQENVDQWPRCFMPQQMTRHPHGTLKTTPAPFHGVHLFHPPPNVRVHRPHVFHPRPARDSPLKHSRIFDDYESCNCQVRFAQIMGGSHSAR